MSKWSKLEEFKKVSDYFKKVGNSQVAVNAGFLFITQVINYIFPLLALKYLVTVLGVHYFGKVSFAQSFIAYFIILVDYGFNISATKQIAINRRYPDKVSQIFYNVIFAKGILLLVSFVILIVCVIFFDRFAHDAVLYISFFGVVIGSMLFPQWFFQGIEKMGYVTLVNAVTKVLFLLSVFILVRTADDYIWVPTLYSLSYILPGIYGFLIAKKRVTAFKIPNRKNIIVAFSDGFSLFLSSAMGTILSGSAIFVLGFIGDDTTVGYYAAFDRLVKAAIMIFAPITLAIYPNVSRKFAESHYAGYSYVKKIAIPTVLLAVILGLGLVFFSRFITLILYKADFLQYRPVLYVLSAWLVVSVINNFIGVQYLSASGKSKLYAKAFTIAGVSSLLLIYLLTRYFSYMGTAFSVLGGEILLTLLMLLLIFFDKQK
jgi:PST family polysaccharide transporter